jgi:RNase P/RNase MRP subunit POP5
LRRKRRYMLVRVRPPDAVTGQQAFEALKGSVRTLFGEVGLLLSDLRLLREERGFVVVRCSLGQVWNVVLAATLTNEVEGRKVALDVVRISGSLRKVKETLSAFHS